MTSLEPYSGQPQTSQTGEIISNLDIVRNVYQRQDFYEALECFGSNKPYADPKPHVLDEHDIDEKLATFATILAPLAIDRRGSIDTAMLREGFNLLANDMDKVAAEKLGYRQPATLGKTILIKFGIHEPQPRTFIHRLDDKFWNVQFMQQFQEANPASLYFPPRQADESDESYLPRYYAGVLHGFAFSHFSFLPHATRWA